MAFLEKRENLISMNNNFISQTYAKTINYSRRFAAVI